MLNEFVSCAPALLYDQGGYYENLVHDFADLPSPRSMADLGELFPAYAANRQLDPGLISASPGFLDRLFQHYRWINQTYTRGAASRVVRLSQVYAIHNTLFLIEGNTASAIYETARPADRAANSYRTLTPDELRASAVTVECANPTLYLCSAGSANYGHWLVDDLPRATARALIAARTGQPVVDVFTPGFGSEINAVKRRSIERMQENGTKGMLHFIPGGQILHFPELYYATPVSFHPALKSPDALRQISRIGRTGVARGPARVYVTRGTAFGRQIVNAAEVTASFEAAGFVTIDVDGKPFDEQAAAFADAEIVAGCMGAAMTSTVFCKPGTRVLHLAPDGWMEPFYWDLANACQHMYAAIYGQTSPSGPEPHRCPFVIETHAIVSMLAKLLA